MRSLRSQVSPIPTLPRLSPILIAAGLAALLGCKPAEPTSVVATPGQGEVTVTWTAPDTNLFHPIKNYTVVTHPSGKKAVTTRTRITISDLTNGTPYTFTVHANNWRGAGEDGLPSEPVMPSSPPGAPTDVTAEINGIDAQVSWVAPAANSDQPITEYKVVSEPSSHTVTTGDTNAAVLGLVAGTTYRFTVTASNAGGEGPASQPSAPVSANFSCQGESGIDKNLATELKNNTGDVFYRAAASGSAGPPGSCQILGDPTSIVELTWQFRKGWAYSKSYNIEVSKHGSHPSGSPAWTLACGGEGLSEAEARALIDKDRQGTGCSIDWTGVADDAPSVSCDDDNITATYSFKRLGQDHRVTEIAYAGGV